MAIHLNGTKLSGKFYVNGTQLKNIFVKQGADGTPVNVYKNEYWILDLHTATTDYKGGWTNGRNSSHTTHSSHPGKWLSIGTDGWIYSDVIDFRGYTKMVVEGWTHPLYECEIRVAVTSSVGYLATGAAYVEKAIPSGQHQGYKIEVPLTNAQGSYRVNISHRGYAGTDTYQIKLI